MALISIKRNVDLQPGLNAPAVFNCSQGDKGTTMMLGLMNGGNDYTVPSGITITIRGSRSNGAVFTPTSATFSGSTVSFTLTEEMTDTAGPTLCEAVLSQGNDVLGTANFIINVEGSPMGADVPPVFTDAAWAWMLGKLTTETVPALGDDVISSIQGKVDKNQGSTNAKKFLRVNTSGNVSLASTDKTLLIADQIADAKETGDQIRALDAEIDGVASTLGGSISTLNGITTDLQSSKLNKNQGASNAGKVLMVNNDGTVSPEDVDLSGKANESTIAPEFDSSASYTAGQYVYKNGVLYKFTSDHSEAWTGTDAETVTVGRELEEVKNLTIPALYGNVGSDFPIEFENGTYRSTVTGQTLEKYYADGYDLTRKVIKSTTFDAPCKVVITAKTGYAFTVFTSVNGVITGNTGFVTSYIMTPGNQYGIILRSIGGTDDISALDASQMVDIEYVNNISESITPEFSASATYIKGQYVYKDGILYKFTLSHTGEWTGTDVEVVTVSGEVKEVTEIVDQVLVDTDEIDFSLFGTIIYNISPSTNKWATNSNYQSYIVAVPNNAKNVSVTANSNNLATIALLKTSSHVVGEIPDYATGQTRTSIIAGETLTISVPSDCDYLWILKTANGGSTIALPQSVVFEVLKEIPGIDSTLTQTGMAADAKTTGDKINDLSDTVDELNDVLIQSFSADPEQSSYGTYITASNEWGNSTSSSPRACGIMLIPEGYNKIKIKAHADNYTQVAILENSSHGSGTSPTYATGWDNVRTVAANTEETYEIPENGKYLYYTKFFGTNQRTPQSIVFTRFVEIKQIPPLDLHEMPDNQNLLNIVKRCRQMTDIEWTPAVDLPRFMLVQRAGEIPDTADSQHYLGTFKAGVKYHGIPYGRVSQTMDDYGYDYGTVGNYIDFKTFVTSVENKDSMLCKRDVSSIASHISVAYATVCSGMTCYALDVPEVSTAGIANISGLSLVGKLNNNGVLLDDSLIKIGYVLNLASVHTAIITDIIRDTDGIIQFVELSDASSAGLADRNYSDGEIGGVCRRKGWTRSAFYQAGSWGDYSVYRYGGAVTYTPSLYVNVGDEFDCQRIEHFPCMPYEGEGFVYKTGYIPNNAIKILISLDGYGYLKVFKNGTEISGSPFVVTAETTSIDISVLDEGSYVAYLCNITDGNVVNLAYPCHWTIET